MSSKRAVTQSGASAQRGCVLRVSNRSEEHTSELQSRLHLVCRLLLEKKKTEALHYYPTAIHLPPPFPLVRHAILAGDHTKPAIRARSVAGRPLGAALSHPDSHTPHRH